MTTHRDAINALNTYCKGTTIMRFTLTITPPAGTDLEQVAITFKAANWEAAAKIGDVTKRQLGIKGESVITYAPPTREEQLFTRFRRQNRDMPFAEAKETFDAILAERGIDWVRDAYREA